MKPDKRITNREFKLLLKPDGLDRRSRVLQLSELLIIFCKKSEVLFNHIDNANTGLRTVNFYDTPDEDLRRNKLILRIRESRHNVWVDDWCELTLKCRAHTLEESLAMNPKPLNAHHRLRLKEEILRDDEQGTMKSIYSNNAIMDMVPLDKIFDRSLESVAAFFPGISKLKLPKNTPVNLVGGKSNKVLEACLPLGNLFFGENVHAHCDIGIWMRNIGEPIIGELAFSYHVNSTNRDDTKSHKKADKFFRKLQTAIPEWLAEGTTKTALIYGKPE